MEKRAAERGSEDYQRLGQPPRLNPCPSCGIMPELWEFKNGEQYHKFVCCPTTGKGKGGEYQCPFYFPPDCFYKATKKEAIAFWQKHTSRFDLENSHLTFARLREASRENQKNWPECENWEPSQWLQAFIGEIGEYANFRKKFERGDLLWEDFQEQAELELADSQMYLDRLADSIGVDLGTAVVKKFNKKAAQIGSPVRLSVSLPKLSGPEEIYKGHPSHVTRGVDALEAVYDLVCSKCGATNTQGDRRLMQPCAGVTYAQQV